MTFHLMRKPNFIQIPFLMKGRYTPGTPVLSPTISLPAVTISPASLNFERMACESFAYLFPQACANLFLVDDFGSA